MKRQVTMQVVSVSQADDEYYDNAVVVKANNMYGYESISFLTTVKLAPRVGDLFDIGIRPIGDES